MVFGDPHNFGRFVRSIKFNGSSAIEKPRTVFWENLFFGSLSPLRPLVDTSQTCTNDIASRSFFQLQCLAEYRCGGVMSELLWSSSQFQERFSEFGQLLAYCFIFGIQDLHHENVFATEQGLQPVDAEVVLSHLELPDQTQLLNRRHRDSKCSVLDLLTQSPNQLTFKQLNDLAAGYLMMFDTIAENRTAITASILAHIAKSQFPPEVRVLLRPTKYYRSLIETQKLPDDLLESERIQLDRGDIPYFFKYVDQPELYYFGASIADSIVVDPGRFSSMVDSTGVNPCSLLRRDRLAELRIRGLIYLFRHHLASNGIGDVRYQNLELVVTDTDIYVRSENQKYVAKRLWGSGDNERQ